MVADSTVCGRGSLERFSALAGMFRYSTCRPCLADDNPQRPFAERLRLLAEVQSIKTIHEGGGAVPRTTDECLSRRGRLRRDRPDLGPWPKKRSSRRSAAPAG